MSVLRKAGDETRTRDIFLSKDDSVSARVALVADPLRFSTRTLYRLQCSSTVFLEFFNHFAVRRSAARMALASVAMSYKCPSGPTHEVTGRTKPRTCIP